MPAKRKPYHAATGTPATSASHRPQPPALQRKRCELAVKRLPGAANALDSLTPAGPVQRDERVEVGVETDGIVGEPVS